MVRANDSTVSGFERTPPTGSVRARAVYWINKALPCDVDLLHAAESVLTPLGTRTRFAQSRSRFSDHDPYGGGVRVSNYCTVVTRFIASRMLGASRPGRETIGEAYRPACHVYPPSTVVYTRRLPFANTAYTTASLGDRANKS